MIRTVADLRAALAAFPDDMALSAVLHSKGVDYREFTWWWHHEKDVDDD